MPKRSSAKAFLRAAARPRDLSNYENRWDPTIRKTEIWRAGKPAEFSVQIRSKSIQFKGEPQKLQVIRRKSLKQWLARCKVWTAPKDYQDRFTAYEVAEGNISAIGEKDEDS